MVFPLQPQLEAAILRQYHKNISRYPVVQREVEAFLQGQEEPFVLCLKYLYGHMAAQDVLSVSVEALGGYVQGTLQALGSLEYLKTVPPEIFFPYVLYPRVNSECLDESRGFLMEELLPYVQNKDMEQAALAVNYWCYAHATYTPADDRTLGPLGVLHRTLGRCGEESVLAVAALRSVGIPARQCYCPRWSHCDDNHAWVEVWIQGSWHYLGACEPEPVLDRGWFTAAASRAMLVDTKCWADWDEDQLYRKVNCTARYTHGETLTVKVTETGVPAAGARVCFQVVNYSELYTLWETVTDEQGFAYFETGSGDLVIFAQSGRKVAIEKVDLRKQKFVTLALQQEFPEQLMIDMVPPEDSSGVASQEIPAWHTDRLQQCQDHLKAHRAAFAEKEGYLRQAALNHSQIQAFLKENRFCLDGKEALLGTLRPKDFVDITCETLTDALESAAAAREKYPEEIWKEYILAPRIADEMLLPERKKIRAFFPNGFADPGEILDWMKTHMQILPDEGVCSFYPSAFGCLRCGQVPAFGFDFVFAALCRAFGFPARMEPHTRYAQWMDPDGLWHHIRSINEPVKLTLALPAGKQIHYAEHLSIGAWNGSDFVTLMYPSLTMEGSHTFRLPSGLYRITATTRQIDGTASVKLWHLMLTEDKTLQITMPEDQTAQRLKRVSLDLPEGPLQALMEKETHRKHLLVFADPGREPTEHLLREMQELAEGFRSASCRILLLLETEEGLTHPTVKALHEALPEAEPVYLMDPEAQAALHKQMQAGDLRLPFVVCTNGRGEGVYADGNYRIRMAQTLLEILRCQ